MYPVIDLPMCGFSTVVRDTLMLIKSEKFQKEMRDFKTSLSFLFVVSDRWREGGRNGEKVFDKWNR